MSRRSVIPTTMSLCKPPGVNLPVLSVLLSPLYYPTTPPLESAEEEKKPCKYFMTKVSQLNVPDVGVHLGIACTTKGLSIDRATVSGFILND